LNELHLFAGAGGGILGGILLGHRCIGAVEIDPYCRSVLVARQRDGSLPYFPIFPDVRTFDGAPWRGRVDVVAGGFPCQDISVAGSGAGITGERSGLWTDMARIVGDVRPRFVFVENSPALVTRGLGVVLGDLAALGYDCRWQVLSAADCGAPHLRGRIWILGALADADGRQRDRADGAVCAGWHAADCGSCGWPVEPDVGRVAAGIPKRVDRIKTLGNAQVPRVAAAAFAMLAAEFGVNA
jgi:DNA (cytosine-5)-methyltransferase 1